MIPFDNDTLGERNYYIQNDGSICDGERRAATAGVRRRLRGTVMAAPSTTRRKYQRSLRQDGDLPVCFTEASAEGGRRGGRGAMENPKSELMMRQIDRGFARTGQGPTRCGSLDARRWRIIVRECVTSLQHAEATRTKKSSTTSLT